MKQSLVTCLFTLFALAILCCGNISFANKLEKNFSDTTIIRRDSDDNDADEQIIRITYFEKMHRAAQGVDWRKIEAKTNWLNYKNNQLANAQTNYAGGKLKGNWSERGSNNQAGRLDAAEYDSSSNKLYVLNDKGVLFEGVPDSSDWHPLNDQLRFTSYGLDIIPKSTTKRLVVSAGLNAYYTDDDGLSFKRSTGFTFPVEWGGNNVEQIAHVSDSKNTTYCLALEWDNDLWQPLYYLYRSINKGATWSLIHKFTEGQEHEVVLWAPHDQSFLYALENVDGVKTSVYKIQGATVTELNNSAPLASFEPIQFKGVLEKGKTKLYALLPEGDLYKSSDFGKTWTYENTIPEDQSANVIGVSILDSNKIILGGVPNCYRSLNGGISMSLVNDWSEYYGNVANKLHADIRDIYFFKRKNGTEFGIVLCDGGVFRSDDYMNTVHNIGLKGLNIGEFYDVLADPTDASWLFGGSQDQGFQRTSDLSSQGAVDFTQVISGDYGHFQLTRNHQTLWTEYPGGQIYYYYNSHGDLSNNGFDMPGTFLPEVGWILPTAPVYPASQNKIFIAGGNLNGGDGSHLVKLTGGTSSPYNITASQFNYDFKANSDGNGGISAIGTTPLNSSRIYVATEDGEFFYSSNAGSSWSKSSTFNGPGTWYLYGSTIYASKLKPKVVYYAGSGYSSPAVFKSNDGGVSFKPMINGLPPTLVYDLTANADETLLFAATEAGPYVYLVADTTWYSFSGNVAPVNVPYTAVDYDSLTNSVRFATYGRGIWDFKITSQPVIAMAENNSGLALNTIVFPNPVAKGSAINIQMPKASKYIFSLYNAEGILLRQIQAAGNYNMPTSNLASGTYIYLIEENGKRSFGKLIIE